MSTTFDISDGFKGELRDVTIRIHPLDFKLLIMWPGEAQVHNCDIMGDPLVAPGTMLVTEGRAPRPGEGVLDAPSPS